MNKAKRKGLCVPVVLLIVSLLKDLEMQNYEHCLYSIFLVIQEIFEGIDLELYKLCAVESKTRLATNYNIGTKITNQNENNLVIKSSNQGNTRHNEIFR